MAKEKGYFADEGLELKILPYSGANTDVLVAQGKADLGVSFVPAGAGLARLRDRR